MSRGDRLADLAEDVLAGIVGQGLRTVGLAAIFALGSGGLVTALGISQTAAQQVRERLTAAALDQVTAHPGLGTGTAPASEEGEAAAVSLPADAVTLASRIGGVRAAAQSWSVPSTVAVVTRLGPQSQQPASDVAISVVGATSRILDVFDAESVPRSSVDLLDRRETPRVALIGEQTAEALGITRPGPGVRIRVGTIPVEVVGIITRTGRAAGLSSAVLVSPAVARALSGGSAEESLRLRTDAGRAFAVSQVVAAVVRPDQPGAVLVDPVPDLRSLRRGVSTDLDSSAGILAALMLTLAAITTTNVLTMAVNDRRPEIALRRAVGMSRRSVAWIFLLEGAVIGAVGGAVGAAAGVVAVVATAWRQEWDAVLTGWLAPAGLLCGLVVGVVAASRAALSASRIEPALAIRT